MLERTGLHRTKAWSRLPPASARVSLPLPAAAQAQRSADIGGGLIVCRFPRRTVASVLMKWQMARVQMRLLALIVVALASVLLATPLTVAAQQAGKVYQVGHLSGSSKAASTSFMDAFREGMRALGYVEGQNWVLDERYAEGQVERLASLAQALIHQNPDVLLLDHAGKCGCQGRHLDHPNRHGGGRRPSGRGHRPKPGPARWQHYGDYQHHS